MAAELEEAIELERAAAALLMAPATLRKWAAAGKVPGEKVQGRWRFAVQNIENYIDSCRVNPKPEPIPWEQLLAAADRLSAGEEPDEDEEEIIRGKPGKEPRKLTKRYVALLQRTPVWADQAAITVIYTECERLTRRTRIKHHVDHVLPLQGRLVSGLHVHENLRIITARENLKKKNRWSCES